MRGVAVSATLPIRSSVFLNTFGFGFSFRMATGEKKRKRKRKRRRRQPQRKKRRKQKKITETAMDAHNLPPHRSIGHAALPRRKKRARTTTTSRRNETIGLQNKKKRTRRGNVARRPPETARSCVTDRGAVAWPMAEMKKKQQKTTKNHTKPPKPNRIDPWNTQCVCRRRSSGAATF